MSVKHTNRRGQTYYLHSVPTKSGGLKYSFSKDPGGVLADRIPDGFEIHETVNGQVLLRRVVAPLITADEVARVQGLLDGLRTSRLYVLELKGTYLIIHEAESHASLLAMFAPHLSAQAVREASASTASYQAVMRFELVDREKRLFAPERYCFRGSVDGWISIGEPETLARVAGRYLRHLGQESFFELY